MAVVIGIGAIAAVLIWFWKRDDGVVTSLGRNSSGGGSYTTELEAEIEGIKGTKDITVEIPEQIYAEDTVDEHLEEAERKLKSIILNKNESFERVTGDMNLVTKIPDTGIRISWTVSDYEVMDGSGHIVAADPGEEGCPVIITADLSYGEHHRIWEKEVLVCRRDLSSGEELALQLESLVKLRVSDEPEKQSVTLPSEIEGRKITWRVRGDYTVLYVLGLSFILALLIPAKRIQDEKQAAEKRRQELEMAYPDLIRRFQLYTGAGMSVRNAFQKLAEDYRKEKGEEACIYKEIQRLVREIGSGISEGQCYEAFGERCGLGSYRKFSAILTQNLRKGTKGMKEILKKEAEEAFEERKALARRRGEEASTKLLGPMFLMLATVLVIVIIPAFLSIQI